VACLLDSFAVVLPFRAFCEKGAFACYGVVGDQGTQTKIIWEVEMMENRIGIIGIVIEDLEAAEPVNAILHDYASSIIGRMGLPYRERGVSVITLIVDGNNDEISALTGKLGRIPGVSVKSMVTKNNPQ
jgi:putative iron-only hydrogenase system regulator